MAGSSPEGTPSNRLRSAWSRPPTNGVAIGVAIGAPIVTAWLLSGLRTVIQPANGALVLVVIVVAVAATGHRVAGVAAALSSAFSFDLFLTEPVHRLSIADPADVVTAVLLILVGLAVSEIALWGRRRQGEAARRLGHLDGLVTTARLLAETDDDPETTLDLVARQIAEVLDVPACRYEHGPPAASTATITTDGRLVENGRDLDAHRSGLPTMAPVVIPVEGGGVVHGRYVIDAPTEVVRPDREQLRVAAALAAQVSELTARRRT